MDILKNHPSSLSTNASLDAADLLCKMATPAEADMIRMIALNDIYKGHIPLERIKTRLRYTQPWDYYDSLFYEIFDCPNMEALYCEKIRYYYENNLYTLSNHDMTKSCPFHNELNRLAVLYQKDGSVFDLCDGTLEGIISVAANLELDYREIISFADLKDQLDMLNSGSSQTVRTKRYDRLMQYTEVQYIEKHPYFPELNGQRGVFAKCDIPKGTILGYYSGDAARMGDDMPPLLCSWPLATYNYKLSFILGRRFIQSYTQWTDGYSLGNAMKLVNTAVPNASGRQAIKPKDAPSFANIACYFGHFETSDIIRFISVPFYISYKDIKKGEELMTFYPL